jgi:hypothetical protein
LKLHEAETLLKSAIRDVYDDGTVSWHVHGVLHAEVEVAISLTTGDEGVRIEVFCHGESVRFYGDDALKLYVLGKSRRQVAVEEFEARKKGVNRPFATIGDRLKVKHGH